jgi:tetratricopeptide (TPR) repeat protein
MPRNQVFISYSHQDPQWRDLLLKHLKPLMRTEGLRVWSDTDIKAGEKWHDAINEAVSSASVAVLLVSVDFLNSEFIAEHELPALQQAAQRNELTLLWVPVRDTSYEKFGFADHQAAHDPKRPLNTLDPREWDTALKHIARKVSEAYAKQVPTAVQAPGPTEPTPPQTTRVTAGKFYGRVQELEDIGRRLERGDRAIVMSGVPGIGKSALALRVPRHFSSEFTSDLGDLAMDPLPRKEDVVGRIAQRLFGGWAKDLSPEKQEEQVINAFHDTAAVLIVDNYEAVVSEVARPGDSPQRARAVEIGRFFGRLTDDPDGQGVLLVTTSEDAIQFATDVPLDIGGVDLVTALHIYADHARRQVTPEVRQKIKKWEEERRRGRAPSEQEIGRLLPRLVQLMQALDRHPLAIRLVAGVLAKTRDDDDEFKAATEVSNLLQNATDAYEEVERHKTVAASFRYGFNKLPDEATRQTFLRLSVFNSPFARRSAEAVLYDVAQVGRHLLGLHDRGLLERLKLGRADDPFYVLRPLARWYASQNVDRDGLGADTLRLARHYSGVLAEITSGPASNQSRWLEVVLPDLKASFAALEGEEREAFGERLAGLLTRAGRYSEAIGFLEQVATLSKATGNHERTARTLHDRANLHRRRGEYTPAVPLYGEALAIWRHSQNRIGEGWTLHELGNVARAQGNLHAAIPLYEEALEIWKQVGEANGHDWTSHELANVYRDLGNLDSARKIFEELLSNARGSASKSWEARSNRAFTFTQLANISRLRESPDVVAEAYEDALDIWVDLEAQDGPATTLHDAATFLEWLGRLDTASELFTQALALHQKLNDVRGTASDWHEMGNIARLRGRSDEAEVLYGNAVEVWTRTMDMQGLAVTRRGLGCLYRDTDRLDLATDQLNRSLEVWMDIKSWVGQAYTIHELGVTEKKSKRLELAAARFNEALALWQQMGDLRGRTSTLVHLGEVQMRMGQAQSAIAAWTEASSLLAKLGGMSILGTDPDDVISLFHQHGVAQQFAGELERAKAWKHMRLAGLEPRSAW